MVIDGRRCEPTFSASFYTILSNSLSYLNKSIVLNLKSTIMRIKFMTSNYNALCIDIGYNTFIVSSMYWITITREYYSIFGGLAYYERVYGLFKHPKYWTFKRNKSNTVESVD